MSLIQRFFAEEGSSAENWRGQDLSIAILDTGISPVEDFILPYNRIIAFRDLVNGKQQPYDDNGHGTHVPVRNNEKIKISNVQLLPAPYLCFFLRLR